MIKSSFTKLIMLFLYTMSAVSTLNCFDMQREYTYLSALLHNVNAPAFVKQLRQLASSPAAKTPEFHQMLTTLGHDLDHALLNTQALHGANMSGSIADNSFSQGKWGIIELALAALFFKMQSTYKPENIKLQHGILIAGFSSGVFGLLSLKNCVTNYFLSRYFGNHVQKTLEALKEMKSQITMQLNAQ